MENLKENIDHILDREEFIKDENLMKKYSASNLIPENNKMLEIENYNISKKVKKYDEFVKEL